MYAFTRLLWEEVDPAFHVFSTDAIRTALDTIEPSLWRTKHPRKPPFTFKLDDALDEVLSARFGMWVLGRRWTIASSGIVEAIMPTLIDGDIEVRKQAVADALADLHERLTILSSWFREWAAEHEGRLVEEVAAVFAARLVDPIVEWTMTEDAWYDAYQVTLAWGLESIGVRATRAREIADEASDGRFRSWVGPTPEDVRAVVEQVRQQARSPEPEIDSLAVWETLRAETEWVDPDVERRVVCRDSHLAFLEHYDRPRGAERADRMREALLVARDEALEGAPLTFASLRGWQRHVLGEAVDFRQGVAFAHHGTERYGFDADTERRFAGCLKEASDSTVSTAVRAARVYLDVCYFHPFPDGNARAARLALDFVLTRDGHAIHDAAPLFLITRRAGDRHNAAVYCALVARLTGRYRAR